MRQLVMTLVWLVAGTFLFLFLRRRRTRRPN
jgi:hypothetical protein